VNEPSPASGSPDDPRPDHAADSAVVLPLPPDARTVGLTLLTVAPRQGLAWVRRGFSAFARRPLALAGLFALFLFCALMLMLVPLLGGIAVLLSLPLVSLGFMLATQAIEHQRVPLPGVFFAPLRTDAKRRIALLQLGIGYALASFVVVGLTDWLDGGKFEALQAAMASQSEDSRQQVDALLSDGQLQAGVALRLLMAAALAVPFWHAPALVHWGGQGALQALFSSTLACWRNKGAFVAFAAGWVLLVGLFVLLVNLLAMALQAPAAITAVVMPAALMFSTVFYASLYFTFADCFGVRGDASTTH
jgi:hypothetical protein